MKLKEVLNQNKLEDQKLLAMITRNAEQVEREEQNKVMRIGQQSNLQKITDLLSTGDPEDERLADTLLDLATSRVKRQQQGQRTNRPKHTPSAESREEVQRLARRYKGNSI